LSRFENIDVRVKETLKMCPSFEENPLYSIQFHNDIMGSIIPVIPMWTGVMRFKVFGSIDRASNAPAKSWFGDLKTNKKSRRMKCARFIQLTRSIILSKFKEVLLDKPSNYCSLPSVQNKQNKLQKKNLHHLLIWFRHHLMTTRKKNIGDLERKKQVSTSRVI